MSNTPKSSLIGSAAWALAVLLATFILFALLVAPAIRYGNQGAYGHGYQPPAAPREATEFAPVKGAQAPGIDLAKALAGDPALADRAREIYSTVCTACHGPEGRGDGPAGAALGARDFTRPEGWKNGPRKVDVFRTLSHGLPPNMPAYDTYSPAERFALANLVASFGAFDHGRASAPEIAALDAEYSLTAGVKEPNRVPVAAAMAAIAAARRAPRLDPGALTPGQAALVGDLERAARTLAGLPAGLDAAGRARALAAGAPGNGFQPALATLDGEGWRRLDAALEAALIR